MSGEQPDDKFRNRLVEDQLRIRRYTLDALREQVVQQFVEETTGRSDILSELNSPEKQRSAVSEILNYVLSLESVILTLEEKRWLIDSVFKDLFRLGPLDGALADDTITEISITATRQIFVRHSFGDLEPYEKQFEARDDFAQLLQNVLSPLGIDLAVSDPFLEAGLTLADRPMRFSLMGPPVMPFYSGEIRLHPRTPLLIDKLAVPTIAVELLQKIVSKGHGLLIVGEGGVGKTTLLANLFQYTNKAGGLVQRAHEIHLAYLPSTLQDYTEIAKNEPATRVFERQIKQAINEKVETLFVDEIHGDEGGAFWAMLTSLSQLVMTFRGNANSTRLHSALSMSLRKIHRTLPQAEINAAFLAKLPFVVVLSPPLPKAEPRMVLLGQWVQRDDGLILEPLVVWETEPVRTDIQPIRDL